MGDNITVDISAWLGKPPERPKIIAEAVEPTETTEPVENALSPASHSSYEQLELSGSDGSSDGGDIVHDDRNTAHKDDGGHFIRAESISDDESELDANGFMGRPQQQFYIEVPRMPEEEKKKYEYLPGHFSVRKVLSKREDNHYVVELESGERDVVSGFVLIAFYVL